VCDCVLPPGDNPIAVNKMMMMMMMIIIIIIIIIIIMRAVISYFAAEA
jgi:hypothetical protein